MGMYVNKVMPLCYEEIFEIKKWSIYLQVLLLCVALLAMRPCACPCACVPAHASLRMRPCACVLVRSCVCVYHYINIDIKGALFLPWAIVMAGNWSSKASHVQVCIHTSLPPLDLHHILRVRYSALYPSHPSCEYSYE